MRTTLGQPKRFFGPYVHKRWGFRKISTCLLARLKKSFLGVVKQLQFWPLTRRFPKIQSLQLWEIFGFVFLIDRWMLVLLKNAWFRLFWILVLLLQRFYRKEIAYLNVLFDIFSKMCNLAQQKLPCYESDIGRIDRPSTWMCCVAFIIIRILAYFQFGRFSKSIHFFENTRKTQWSHIRVCIFLFLRDFYKQFCFW